MEKNPHFKSKLPNIGPTIFSTMSALAHDYNAVNLSQGFPDFEVDPKLIALVEKNMRMGKNQYAPYTGIKELRDVLSKQIHRDHGHSYDADLEVNITAGATQAIATVLTASINPGDEVILFSPSYDCYAPYIELNGGKPVFVELDYPSYSINWEAAQKAISANTRMIIINSPHNPSASAITAKDLLELEKITAGTDILILADEVYEHIVFDGKKHLSVCSRPNLVQRCFLVGSLGKTLHITGWKTGFCMAPQQMMEEFRKVHQFMVFSVNTPMQYALAEYLQEDESFRISKMYQGKRDTFLKAIEGSRFKALKSEGTYFQLLDYSDISNENDVDFAIRLTKEHGVASIPLSVFYPDGLDHKTLRFCFAKNDETLKKAGDLLRKI